MPSHALGSATSTVAAASAVAARFTELWSDPPAAGYRFLDMFAPHVRLQAPLAGRSVGAAAGYEAFRRTFCVFPDLTAAVDGWAFDGKRLYIAMRFRTAAGRFPIEWSSVDVLVFEQGKVVQRRAYFDPTRLIIYVLKHPALVYRWIRARFTGVARWPNGASTP